jgi:hypothetical protein
VGTVTKAILAQERKRLDVVNGKIVCIRPQSSRQRHNLIPLTARAGKGGDNWCVVDTEHEIPRVGSADPFSVEIDLRHPSYDPAKITERLSLEPGWSWKSGTQLGNVVAPSSRWHGQLVLGSSASEYEAALTQVVSFLTLHEEFFAAFREGGGDVELVLNHVAMLEEPRGVAFEVELSPILLAHLSSRGISLRVRAWSSNPSWAS